MNNLYIFFNNPIFTIIGGFTFCVTVLGIIYKIFCWFFGITPIIFRLGVALWKRKIAILGDIESLDSLKSCISDSNIFSEKNIVTINLDNLDKVKDQTIILVDWESAKDKLDQVFSSRKNHQTAIVIYAKPASIPQEKMNDIANRANTVVVNFRGRLLNDILTSLITTTYDQQ